MSKKLTFRIPRSQPGSINPGSYGRKAHVEPLPVVDWGWVSRMQAAQRGAAEVVVKISGGGRDAGGVEAHLKYISRHGKLELETDQGEVLRGRQVANAVCTDWLLDEVAIPGAPHSRIKQSLQTEKKLPRQAFNIVLSMPAGTAPDKVLAAVRRFARENFAYQHRYAMALHAQHKDGRGEHPHVHLVVKAEHEYGGPRLNPRKADLERWREQFAAYMTELGVPSTATRRQDRGLVKNHKKDAIYRSMQRRPSGTDVRQGSNSVVGDSRFMQQKLEARQSLAKAEGNRIRDQLDALVALRSTVQERYRTAIDALREQGLLREAQRLERMLRALPPVQIEQHQSQPEAAQDRGATR